jgi:hypothetical protein
MVRGALADEIRILGRPIIARKTGTILDLEANGPIFGRWHGVGGDGNVRVSRGG